MRPGDDIPIVGEIRLEPNWEGMRAWLRNVARTDIEQALIINTDMHCEGLDPQVLRDEFERFN